PNCQTMTDGYEDRITFLIHAVMVQKLNVSEPFNIDYYEKYKLLCVGPNNLVEMYISDQLGFHEEWFFNKNISKHLIPKNINEADTLFHKELARYNKLKSIY